MLNEEIVRTDRVADVHLVVVRCLLRVGGLSLLMLGLIPSLLLIPAGRATDLTVPLLDGVLVAAAAMECEML